MYSGIYYAEYNRLQITINFILGLGQDLSLINLYHLSTFYGM